MPAFRCVIHGSFRKHFREIMEARRVFTAAGIEVLAPAASEINAVRNGFTFLEGEAGRDPRQIELAYLTHLRRLGEGGFSYFVNPEGYIGKSASYELGIAQATNVRCFFAAPPADHPVYVPHGSVWSPADLAAYIVERGALPAPQAHPDEQAIHRLWQELLVPGSVVAVGGIIEYREANKEPQVLLVRTHKWGGRFSIVGGKVRRHERLDAALAREVAEETGLAGAVGRHICTFDQIKNSGYYLSGVNHVFVDYVFRATSKRVMLNDEAEDFVWMPAGTALRDLDIEPNARQTLVDYAALR